MLLLLCVCLRLAWLKQSDDEVHGKPRSEGRWEKILVHLSCNILYDLLETL